jgi:magnesium transporter
VTHVRGRVWRDGKPQAIKDELFENNPRNALQRKTFRLRKDLVELRRVLDPLYSDLYDHVLRASEWTESLRDMVTTVFETNLSLQDARLNTVMKKLTGWAAIIAVPTAITGFYGQNVEYPGINTVGGFLTSTSIIVLIVITLYWMFRRRDWL